MNDFVSRGGLKLQAAIEKFVVEVKDKVILDVGSSTGGFVDCLLQNGAARVYSVDTAYGELAWKLRNDPRVVVMERTNILRLQSLPQNNVILGIPTLRRGTPESDSGRASLARMTGIGGDDGEKVDLITIDAGWTKLELVLPAVEKFLKPEGQIIALLKPHYEAEKRDLVKGILPPEKAEEIKNQVIKRIEDLGFKIEEVMDSPILGGGGNKEYLLLIKT